MTKIANPEVKPPPPPVYSSVPMADLKNAGEQDSLEGSKLWHILSILATIFCCLPCGIVGLVHAMIAKHEGEKQNFAGFRRRMYQAKCWTSWSIGIGLLTIIVVIVFVIGMTVGFSRSCSVLFDDYYWDHRNGSSWWNSDYRNGSSWWNWGYGNGSSWWNWGYGNGTYKNSTYHNGTYPNGTQFIFRR